MSNNIDTLDNTEQARRHIRVTAGKDTNTGEYSVNDVNVDGKLATRSYVWDSGTMSWVAQAATQGINVNYDKIEMTYDGNNRLTGVVYTLSGVPVSTLTLEYTNGNLTKVTRA